jgi:hypothetical protein
MKNTIYLMGILSLITSCFVGKSKKAEARPTQQVYCIRRLP